MASELIRTACPSCATKIGVRPDQLGRRIRCPKCRGAFAVSRPEVAAEPPEQAPVNDSSPWQAADDANELAAVGRGRQVWHRAKISAKFDRPRDLLFQAAVQTVRNARCDVIHIDWANAHLRFALFVSPGQPTEHDLFAFPHPTGGSELEVTSQEPNVEGLFDPLYDALMGDLGKYLHFAPRDGGTPRSGSATDATRAVDSSRQDNWSNSPTRESKIPPHPTRPGEDHSATYGNSPESGEPRDGPPPSPSGSDNRRADDEYGDERHEPAHNKYCFECGQRIRSRAEICPKCGVRQLEPDDAPRRSGRSKDSFKVPLLISAIANIVVGLLRLSTCFGIVFTIPMIVLCVIEFSLWSKADDLSQRQIRQQARTLAIFEVVVGLANTPTLICGIILLIKTGQARRRSEDYYE